MVALCRRRPVYRRGVFLAVCAVDLAGGRGPVLQCFGNVVAADSVCALQIRQSAGDLEQAVGGSKGQGQALAGAFQPGFIRLGQRAMLAQPREIQERIGATLALLLMLSSLGDQRGGGGCVAAGLWGRVQRGDFAGDRQVQVDPIQQGPGEFVAIALDLLGRAHITAGAGVHRRHQLEARGEAHSVTGAGNHDVPRLQWLAQDLQHLAIKLREFIQEQHSMMGQGDFPRLRFRSAVGFLNSCESTRLEAARYGF